ncbi:iron-sulfur cluster assembly scaffold protein [Sphingomicrobium lutaoense]|uniref:NifU-like protein involved in Fe-S cluster formation n=1 Tax=Sphingomicrobium lutaoense TaxID=515949 RepID=A0A839YVR9_9SPHN|nr:iron-sulfur cluster assembly scaffold protein [Sphingomicrobium lutaoense]MBB3763299.1 NifU-like protein involved in Fe-S cluster formation [Sphingomicrobium lutaoense]
MAAGLKPTPYTRDILRLAASIPHLEPIADPQGRREMRSRTCGARMAAQYRIEEGKLAALGLEVEACAFGQAAANLMARHALGSDVAMVRQAAKGLEAWLKGEAAEPQGWPELERLSPARHLAGRHEAMMLPFRLLLSLFEESR